jgi:GAF domain-containing protein
LAGRIAQLAGVRLSGSTLESILEHVAQETCRSVAGAEHVGVSLVRGDQATTSAATDDAVLAVDLAQYETGEGPCLDASRDQRVYVIEEMDREPRWPRFAARAWRLGVGSSLSVPLSVEAEPLGALNIYASDKRAFDDAAVQIGQTLAAAAGILLDNAQTHAAAVDLARHLEEAMKTRAVIEQAKGILIARHGYTPERAFDELRLRSQHANRKLRDIAGEIVARSITAG